MYPTMYGPDSELGTLFKVEFILIHITPLSMHIFEVITNTIKIQFKEVGITLGFVATYGVALLVAVFSEGEGSTQFFYNMPKWIIFPMFALCGGIIIGAHAIASCLTSKKSYLPLQ